MPLRYLRLRAPTLVALTALGVAASCGEPTAPKQAAVNLDSLVSPTAADFSAEATLAARYTSLLVPMFDAGAGGSIAGVAGVSLVYRVFTVPAEKGAIVLLPGKAEPARKYAEVIWDLTRQGYTVYVMDWRGQGASGRMTDNPQMEYVEFFRDYVDDLHTFVQTVVRATSHPRVFLLAHSMGGAVATLYVDKYPADFDAAVLSSPMIELDMGAFPSSIGSSIAYGTCSRGDGKSYAIGQGNFDPNQTFANEDATHSQARFDAKMTMYTAHPEVRVGGVSYRWLCESITATAHIRTLHGPDSLPLLIFSAGEDVTVHAAAEADYCDRAPRCQRVNFPTARHEILQETDSIRNRAMAYAVRFFNVAK